MKRIIDHYLLDWKQYQFRKPLLLRGARQVGKTFAVRELGKTYESFVEINFELSPRLRSIFEYDLKPQRIIQALSIELGESIIPGKTLLFIDEIQTCPQAIIALRYFYEMMPDLHIIGAGSLLDFAIQQVGVPVGRVQFLYMYPLTFIEYLVAIKEPMIVQEILTHDLTTEIYPSIHEKILRLLSQYLALGGMPDVISKWITTQNPLDCHIVHQSILQTYRQDFDKYARKQQIKYVEKIFDTIPQQLGQKFKYSTIDGEYRKRELAPALDLLVTAYLANKVYYGSGQGFPIGFQADAFDYKIIPLDMGLNQAQLGLNIAGWFSYPLQEFINKGPLVEAFVGQEFIGYASPRQKSDLYYWHKDSAPQQAEIDYLLPINEKIVPVEVKSGDGRTLKSMHYFLATHQHAPYGIRFSTNNYSQFDKIHSYPLYAIAHVISASNPEMKAAFASLFRTN
ncbi:MAG: AAA family ATPase [Candidatus Chromulinivorax sp.]|nr:AAA family ATPase [Candidatus Chromulinivorax sp.]